MESYLLVRSVLMRLLDPSAMGRFRFLAYGRQWPDGPPLSAFAYEAPRRPERTSAELPGATERPTHD